jgi:DNA polymerase III delta prime subunit
MNIYPNNFSSPFKPNSLNDFVISDEASRKQLDAIVSGRMPFPLFGKNCICLWGMNGSGKSTLALMLPQFLEATAKLIGSSRNKGFFESENYWKLTECALGSNNLSTLSELNERSKSMTAMSPSGWHYEILDEVDLLTPMAMASLKTTITFANSTIFIITTNNPSKLDMGVRDRSILVEMNQPKPEDSVPLAIRFLQKMGLTGNEVPTTTLLQIAKASRGSIREFGTAVATLGLSYGGVIV